MESYVEMQESSEQQERNPGATAGSLLGCKMAELQKLKEKLRKAKDDAAQSWLDSRPLTDELEKLQSELASLKSQATVSSTTISELESQLETMSNFIRSKKEEELKIRTVINRINQALDKTKEEMEQLKTERDEKHRARLQLKQVLRLRKQTLQALQLTLRAVRLESEAHGASSAEAHRYINCCQTDDTLVKLTQQDYHALRKRAEEETSLAEWRIAVAMEQKHAAEESQNSSTRRLQNLYSKDGTGKRKTQSIGLSNQNIAPEAERRHSDVKADDLAKNGQNGFQKTQAKSFTRESQKKPQEQSKGSRIKNKPQEQSKGSRTKNNYLSKKKKRSLFSRIRMFLVQKLRGYFK